MISILSEPHIGIGHRGRTCTLKELEVKYKNITYEVVILYLNLFKQCQMKHSAPKKKYCWETNGQFGVKLKMSI